MVGDLKKQIIVPFLPFSEKTVGGIYLPSPVALTVKREITHNKKSIFPESYHVKCKKRRHLCGSVFSDTAALKLPPTTQTVSVQAKP